MDNTKLIQFALDQIKSIDLTIKHRMEEEDSLEWGSPRYHEVQRLIFYAVGEKMGYVSMLNQLRA